jgi:hypothetical protein
MDDDELPNATLDLYLNDALDQTLALSESWPFLQHSWTVVTVDGQVNYTIDSTVDSIASVTDVDTLSPLMHFPHERAEVVFGDGASGGGVPAYWSQWGNELYLWPAPSEGRTVRLRGYRRHAWGPAATDVVDADDRLHVPLIYWAIARAYAAQEDEVLEATNIQHWQVTSRRAQDQIEAVPSRRPLILSGTGTRFGYPSVRLGS